MRRQRYKSQLLGFEVSVWDETVILFASPSLKVSDYIFSVLIGSDAEPVLPFVARSKDFRSHAAESQGV